MTTASGIVQGLTPGVTSNLSRALFTILLQGNSEEVAVLLLHLQTFFATSPSSAFTHGAGKSSLLTFRSSINYTLEHKQVFQLLVRKNGGHKLADYHTLMEKPG